MNRIQKAFLIALAAVHAPLTWGAEEEWKPTTLSEATRAKVTEAVRAYEQCLNAELLRAVWQETDARALTDHILRTCDDRLAPALSAFQAEGVPVPIAERYLRSRRTQGARELSKVILAAQAQRAALAADADGENSGRSGQTPIHQDQTGKPMEIDLTLIPSAFDAVHVGLAAALLILLLLQIIFLSVAVIALLRRGKEGAIPAAPGPSPEPVVAPAVEPAVKREPSGWKEPTPDAALQLLALLQKEARFVDFVQEDLARFSDAEIGAAARVVHEGCRKLIRQLFDLQPVRAEAEGSRLTLPKGFDASSVRLSGNVVGEPPFTGTLVHRGWRVAEVRFPRVAEGHDTRVIAAAEVEL